MAEEVITPSLLGNEFDLGVIEANKIHLKLDPATLSRDNNGVIGVVPVTTITKALALPIPKVEISQGSPNNGLDMYGNAIDSESFIEVHLDDVPPFLLDGATKPQLELLRIKASGRSKKDTGYMRRGRRFVHPSNTVGGVVTHPAVFGTRGGNHVIAFDRQTEWDLSGLSHFGKVKIPVALVMGSYFFRSKYIDVSAGFGIEGLAYADGQSNRHYNRGKENLQSRGREQGLFAFRYSAINPETGRYESSGMSPIISVSQRIPPTYVKETVDSVPTDVHAYKRSVNLGADGNFVLVARFKR